MKNIFFKDLSQDRPTIKFLLNFFSLLLLEWYLQLYFPRFLVRNFKCQVLLSFLTVVIVLNNLNFGMSLIYHIFQQNFDAISSRIFVNYLNAVTQTEYH